MIRVAVSGAAGRMGETVCEAVDEADDLELAGREDPTLRTRVAGPGPDRHLAPEIAAAEDLIRGGALLAAVQKEIA